jgi:hypothetical protein
LATRVTFHPGLGRFLRLLVIAIAIALLASLVLRFGRRDSSQAVIPNSETATGSIADTLVPDVALCVPEGANEARWVESLMARIGGRKEVVIPNGRIDVLTQDFAIEVDFIQKWHEGIGQALHYASATGKRPSLALIVPHSDWPLRADRLTLLREIDKLSAEQRIRLVVLRPGCL